MFSFILCLIFPFSGYTPTEQLGVVHADSIKRPVRKAAAYDSTARFIKINRIFIVGNKRTRDQIILRELTLRQGDIIYNNDIPAILEADRQRLINTRLFNTVNIRTLELEPDQFDLLIDIKERWYTFPSPIFDLADRNFNEWWQNYDHDFKRVNYGLRLQQFNMRGRNETLRFIAQFGYLRRFELYYRIPYLDRNQKHGLAFDIDYSEAKNVPYRTLDHKLDFYESENIMRTTRGIGVAYLFRNSFYETHGFKVEYRTNQISDSIALLNPNYFGGENQKSQKFPVLTYQFTSDHRDYIAYPLRGYYLTGYLVKSGLSRTDDLDKLEASLTYARFFDLKKNFYLSNNLLSYVSTPNHLPYFNYGALGYRKQFVRGYELYVIEGPAYVLNKTTFKKRILSRNYNWNAMPIEQFRHFPLAIYLKTYADLGYVKNYEDYEIGSRLSNKLLAGVGGGIDIVSSYDMVFRFEYTFNAEGENGLFFHVRKEF